MESNPIPLLALVGLTALSLHAQSTFIYDQQAVGPSEYSTDIRTNQPWGQSFMPALSSVGFVRLTLWDATLGGSSAATVHMDLHSDSITGPVLSSTAPVVLDPSFNGTLDFIFASPVPVSPGTTYYFQPYGQSSDAWKTLINFYNYPGGTAFALGAASPPWDVWFQEGVIVPEPSSPLLLFLGAALFVLARARRIVNQGQG